MVNITIFSTQSESAKKLQTILSDHTGMIVSRIRLDSPNINTQLVDVLASKDVIVLLLPGQVDDIDPRFIPVMRMLPPERYLRVSTELLENDQSGEYINAVLKQLGEQFGFSITPLTSETSSKSGAPVSKPQSGEDEEKRKRAERRIDEALAGLDLDALPNPIPPPQPEPAPSPAKKRDRETDLKRPGGLPPPPPINPALPSSAPAPVTSADIDKSERAVPPPTMSEQELDDFFGGDSPQPPRMQERAAGAGASPAQPPVVSPVQFAAFHPKAISVQEWSTLLVYAYIEGAIDLVRKDAAKYREQLGAYVREAQSKTPAQIQRGTAITFVPTCDGVTFNPEQITIKWLEDIQSAQFRFIADASLAGKAGNIRVSVFVNPLIVATLEGGLLFEEKHASSTAPIGLPNTSRLPSPSDKLSPLQSDGLHSITASLYDAEQIFVSYSHKDTPIALACRNVYKALGYDVLIDVDTLRSGEKWNAALMRMIDRADVFQLFWSTHTAESKYCEQEWRYALEKANLGNLEGFIRPVYWRKPLPPPPNELEDFHFAYVELPQQTTTFIGKVMNYIKGVFQGGSTPNP